MLPSDYNIPVEVSNRDEVMEVANDYDTEETYFQVTMETSLAKPEEMATRPGDRVLERAEEDATLDIIVGEGVYPAPLELEIEDRDTHEQALNDLMMQIRTGDEPAPVWGKVSYRSKETGTNKMPHGHPSERHNYGKPSGNPESPLKELEARGFPVEIRGHSRNGIGNPTIRDLVTYNSKTQELDPTQSSAAIKDIKAVRSALQG
jgi:hypothetical protein